MKLSLITAILLFHLLASYKKVSDAIIKKKKKKRPSFQSFETKSFRLIIPYVLAAIMRMRKGKHMWGKARSNIGAILKKKRNFAWHSFNCRERFWWFRQNVLSVIDLNRNRRGERGRNDTNYHPSSRRGNSFTKFRIILWFSAKIKLVFISWKNLVNIPSQSRKSSWLNG